MSGTTYVVTLSLQTQGNFGTQLAGLGQKASSAHSQVLTLGRGCERVGEMGERAARRVGGAFEGMADTIGHASLTAAKFGAGGALALAAYGVGKLNNNLEQTQISLGAIAQAQGFTSTFERGFEAAGEQLQKMKQDVKTLPGDLGQLSDLMKMIATPAAQGGAGLDQIRKLAGRTMLTSTILGVQQEVASREMAGLLSGRAGSHNILGSRLGLIGDDAKKFNAMAPEARLSRINKELDKYQGAADRFGHSFIAQWTTMKDNIKYSMLAPATSGLFQRFTQGISEANDYLDAHKEKVEELAGLINRRLVGAWDAGEAALKKYGPIIGQYADMLAHMQPGEIAHKLEHAGKMVLAAKVGGMALNGGSGLIGGGVRMLGAIGGAGGAGEGLGAVAEALPAIGAAALPAAAMLGMVAGAVDILTNKSSIYHAQALQSAAVISGNLTTVSEAVKPAAAHAESAIRSFGDYMGQGLLQDAEAGTNAIVAFGRAMSYINPFPNRYGETDDDTRSRDLFNRSVDSAPNISHDAVTLPHLVRMDKTTLGPLADAVTQAKKGGGGGGGGHMDVTIKIDGAADPSRVALLVQSHLRELATKANNPKSSEHATTFAPSFRK
jgi:hypothetical protein